MSFNLSILLNIFFRFLPHSLWSQISISCGLCLQLFVILSAFLGFLSVTLVRYTLTVVGQVKSKVFTSRDTGAAEARGSRGREPDVLGYKVMCKSGWYW